MMHKVPSQSWARLCRLARACPLAPSETPDLNTMSRALAAWRASSPDAQASSENWADLETAFRRVLAAFAALMLVSLAVNLFSSSSSTASDLIELSRLITDYAL